MKSLPIKSLLGVVAISLPLLLSGCETMNSMFGESDHRVYSPDHRPVDIYENDRPQNAQAENRQAGRSYSITNQQGRTQKTTAAEESADAAAAPIAPPSVPGNAPQLAE